MAPVLEIWEYEVPLLYSKVQFDPELYYKSIYPSTKHKELTLSSNIKKCCDHKSTVDLYMRSTFTWVCTGVVFNWCKELINVLSPYNWYLNILVCNQHHHVVPLARIFLTLTLHLSLSFIASGRSSGLHPVSSRSCCMYVRAGRPPFSRPYVGVHRSTSLISSSLLLMQCPACLVHLIIIIRRRRRRRRRRSGECNKLAQKEYKNRLDWVGKAIHWELCKKLKFH